MRIKSGVATPSDRLEFKMKGLDLDQSQRTTSTRFKTLSFDLLVRLGYDLDEPLVIIGQLAHADEWEHDLKHSHKDHEYFSKPSVLYAEELNLMGKQRRRAWMPKLDLYASWHQFNQREEDPTASGERQKSAVGLKVTLDLFDGISARSDSQALAAQASAALAISEFKKKKSEALIEKEFSELKSLHDQVHEVEKLIKMAREYYRATQSEYSRGAKNSPDVLGATEKLEEIQRSKNQLIRDFQVARSHVLSKIGK